MAQIDETNVDTPQEGSNLSVEDAFFSDNNEGNTQQTISEDDAQNVVNQEVNNGPNDEKRFQYWQSQADKASNENQALKQQLNQKQTHIAQTQQQQAAVQKQSEEFPPPPPKHERPSGFNSAEAMEDTSSPSARYYDEVEA